MQYLWQFYLLIVVVLLQGLFLTFGSKSGRVIFLWLCFLELSFLAGFRAWNIGNDTINYVQTFLYSTSYAELLQSHMERGYLLFNQFLALFTSNPQMLLITTSLFIIGVWMRTLYKYASYLLFAMLLFVIIEFSLTMNIIRQEMAVCIILLSIPFIIKRQLIPFLLSVACAVSFHMSAFVAIFLYILYPLKFKMKYLLGACVITGCIYLFLAPVLDQVVQFTGRYGSYIGKGLLMEDMKIATFVNFLIQFVMTSFCCIAFHYQYKGNSQPYPLRVEFLIWCSVVSLCLQFVALKSNLLERMLLYFSVFNLLSVPLFLSMYPKKIRIILFFVLLGGLIAYKSVVLVYRPDWNYVLPFEFCF